MKAKLYLRLMSASALAVILAGAGQAQSNSDAQMTRTASADQPSSSEIIVTGTSRARAAFNTPLAVSSVDNKRLQALTATGQADILNTIPTIKADGGGGEVAANVFVRGLPSGGQYQFTPLEYDGIPVFSTFGLNSSAYDVYYRNDLGLDRLEFVRGGVSNLFGPGSVAGLINYISRTGSDTPQNTVQLEFAERGRARADIASSGPLADNLYYAVSGFYRVDAGPIRTGLDTKGGQARGNLKWKFPDGSGSVTIYGQYIDDQDQYYLPIPLDGATRSRLDGNDGHKVYSVQTDAVSGLGFNTPVGRYTNDIDSGVKTRGGQVAVAFDKKFGDGWAINGKGKWSQYHHRFGLWADGDGVINVPETLQSFLANRKLGSLSNAQFSFADGSPVPSNYLLFANRFTTRNRPATDYTGELNLTKELNTGPISHSFTLGGFYANAKAKDFDITTTYLAEFNNRPQLVNLVVTNPTTGAQTIVSQNGLLNAGSGYTNQDNRAERYAGYIADQMEAGKFSFDVGFRWEHYNGKTVRENSSTFITDTTTPNLSTALRDVLWGNGTYLRANVHTSSWAAAGGLLYKLSRSVNLYLNASRGYFFPEIRSITFDPLGNPASYKPEIIKQVEGGVKFDQGRFNATLAGFYAKLSNRRQILFVNDGNGGFTDQVNIVGTRAYGLEGTLSVPLVSHFRFDGNVTLQNAKYTAFDTSPATVGNHLERQPSFLYNAGLYYDDGHLDGSIFTNYTGHDYTASNNAIRLGSFNVVNLDAGYKIVLNRGSIRFGINVFNLLDTDATTEGSPRQDVNQTVGGAYFVGRPVLPRRITGRMTFNF
jgi:outer membrane receptor protein involved in Fe transport